MTTTAADATVIDLQSHPAWRSTRRYERKLTEAMRRHPSFQSRLDAVNEPDPDGDCPAVLRLVAQPVSSTR